MKPRYSKADYDITPLSDAEMEALASKLDEETYRYVWGDKETYWIGCLMAGQPFHFNDAASFLDPESGLLTQMYEGERFYTQKG